MTQRQRQDAAINSLRLIPTKWAILIVAILIAYVVAQPRLNSWFGINLPSLTSLLGDDSATQKTSAKNSSRPSEAKTKTQNSQSSSDNSESPNVAESGPSKQGSSKRNNAKNSAGRNESAKQESAKQGSVESEKQSSPKSESTKETVKTHGILTPIGNDRFQSPNGLIYGPGSEQGHRIKHIERHLEDDPKRPGSHGVFDGSLEEFLEAIDDAYLRANRGEKGTSRKEEDNTIVFEAPFTKPIGYQGGIDGGKRKNPKLKKLRIVVRGNSLITAFPF